MCWQSELHHYQLNKCKYDFRIRYQSISFTDDSIQTFDLQHESQQRRRRGKLSLSQ